MQREKTQQDKIKNSRVQTILGGGTVQKFKKKRALDFFSLVIRANGNFFGCVSQFPLVYTGTGEVILERANNS
jgi:hypothetical protein